MTEISNIVRVQEGEDQPVETTVDNDTYSRNLAVDAIAFMEEEFATNITPLFWDTLIQKLQEKRGEVPQIVETTTVTRTIMDAKQQKSFKEQQLPWGKYVGQKVGTVLKKDRPSLEKMAIKQLPFQVRLECFLNSLPTPKSSKKVEI